MASSPDNLDHDEELAQRLLNGDKSHAHLCRALQAASPGWLEERFAETDIIVALPRFHDRDSGLQLSWRSALTLTGEDEAAEATLSAVCEAAGMLGISRSGFVNYWFPPPKPREGRPIPKYLLASMKEHGWKDRHLHQTRRLAKLGDGLHRRLAGAAGWMISSPTFLQAREKLRVQWQELPEDRRPPLPLTRTPRLDQAPAGAKRQRASQTTHFWRDFDRFCDEWRLLGMETWDLPNVDGPKWSEDYPGKPVGLSGTEVLYTPWHFPVKGSDGLGEILEERNRQNAAEHGFEDPGRWDTYAHLLLIDFWERTIRSRYAGHQRPKGIVTKIIGLLAGLTGCDAERVKKLRLALHDRQSGKRASLKGIR